MKTEDDQDIKEAETDRRHHHQIHRGDVGAVVAQKRLPALARRPPPSHHVLCHCRLGNLDAELEYLAMNGVARLRFVVGRRVRETSSANTSGIRRGAIVRPFRA